MPSFFYPRFIRLLLHRLRRDPNQRWYYVFNDRLNPIKIYEQEDYQNWVHQAVNNNFKTKKECEKFIKLIKVLLKLKPEELNIFLKIIK